MHLPDLWLRVRVNPPRVNPRSLCQRVHPLGLTVRVKPNPESGARARVNTQG